MRAMTKDETALYQIIKNNKTRNNWDLVRLFYQSQYGVELPDLKNKPTIWTVERWIRLLKETYPHDLTTDQERQIKADQETKYKEMAKPDNRPVKAPEQGSLGLFGEPSWWD